MNRQSKPVFSKLVLVMFFLGLSLFSSFSYAAELKAYVDKNIVQKGQFIQFSLSLSDKSSSKDPDFSVLNNDFEILSSMQRSSKTQIINGSMSSSTSWSITITPRKEGAIVIPPFELAGLKSEAITIVVGKSPEKQYSDAFFETTLSDDEVYVQEQLHLDLKLYIRMADISNSQLENLEISGAKVIPVGEPSQSQVVKDGIRFYLIESSYFIFPERSGELKIPSITYSAVVNEGSRYSRFGTRRRVSAQSDAKTVLVKGIPASYPKDALWLPAQQVTLMETLNPQNGASIGEPITRNIITKAIGQAASALPPATMQASKDLKVYPDQGDTNEKITQQNLMGTRNDAFALIANQAGELELPQYKIPWWDTQNDKLRYAQLDANSITIRGSGSQSSIKDTGISDSPTEAQGSDTGDKITQEITPDNKTLLLIIALLIALWLFSAIAFMLYVRKLKQNIKQENFSAEKLFKQTELEKRAYKKFEAACKQNDIKQARHYLLEWANNYFTPEHISGLTHLAHMLEDEALGKMLEQVDQQLYKATMEHGQVNLNTLNERLNTVLKKKNKSADKKSKGRHLENLYK